jgi:hypothetical protein
MMVDGVAEADVKSCRGGITSKCIPEALYARKERNGTAQKECPNQVRFRLLVAERWWKVRELGEPGSS